jgi:hypothetical protein
MTNEPNQPPAKSREGRKFIFASSLALVPSFLLLTMFAFFVDKKIPQFAILILFVVSATCCFGASFLLMKRNTALAIVLGIFFFLLNGAISFLFGCATFVSGLKL